MVPHAVNKGVTQHVPTGLTVAVGSDLSGFDVAGDVTSVLQPGMYIGTREETGRVIAVKHKPLKHRTYVQVATIQHTQCGDSIDLVKFNVDDSFLHSGLRVESCTERGRDFNIADDATQMLQEGTVIQLAYLPSHGRSVQGVAPHWQQESFGVVVDEKCSMELLQNIFTQLDQADGRVPKNMIRRSEVARLFMGSKILAPLVEDLLNGYTANLAREEWMRHWQIRLPDQQPAVSLQLRGVHLEEMVLSIGLST